MQGGAKRVGELPYGNAEDNEIGGRNSAQEFAGEKPSGDGQGEVIGKTVIGAALVW